MKKFTAILLALVLVLGLAACSSNKPQNPQPTPQETTQEPQTQATEDPGPAPATINVIYHPTIGGSTAIATAISQGYFEEENLTVNLQMYTSGPPEIAAMVAKQADVRLHRKRRRMAGLLRTGQHHRPGQHCSD